MDVALDHTHALLEVDRHAPQIVGVHLDPGALHLQQHRHQPAFQLLVQRERAIEPQPRPQRLPQPQRHIGVLGSVGGGAFDWHLRERDAVAPRAGDLVVADRRVAEMQLRQFVQPVAVHAGLLGVGDQHGIVERRGPRKTRALHHQHVELGVLVDLQDGRITQHRSERRNRRGKRHLLRQHFVAQRHIGGPAGRDRKRKPDERRPHRVQPVGLGVDGEEPAACGLRQKVAQRGLGDDRDIRTEPRGDVR